MTQIATKFVKWDIPELATLQDSKVYKLRVHLNNGGKLNREEKNWITRNVWESIYFKRGIALSGYHFDFSDILKRYFVKQHGSIHEYYAIDKTALRSILYGRIEDIVQVGNGIISVWKRTVMKKPRHSSAHGTVRTCRTSLTTVFAMKSGKHWPIHRNLCSPKKTTATRQ